MILALITESTKYRQSTHSCVSIVKIEKCPLFLWCPTHSRKLGAEVSLLEFRAATWLAMVLWEHIVGLAEDQLLLDLSIFVNCSIHLISASTQNLSLLSPNTHTPWATVMAVDYTKHGSQGPCKLNYFTLYFSRILVTSAHNPALIPEISLLIESTREL